MKPTTIFSGSARSNVGISPGMSVVTDENIDPKGGLSIVRDVRMEKNVDA